MSEHRKLRSVRPFLSLAVLGAFAAAFAVSQAAAQTRPGQTPAVSGQWCGLADNGTVRLRVSADSRFVESITVDTEHGPISSQEGTVVVARAQIADEKFIFRGGAATESRCEPARCRGPNCLPRGSGGNEPGSGRGTVCEQSPTVGITIRGTFLQPDYVRGTYTGVISKVLREGNARGQGRLTQARRVVGNYVAWPAGSAPCP